MPLAALPQPPRPRSVPPPPKPTWLQQRFRLFGIFRSISAQSISCAALAGGSGENSAAVVRDSIYPPGLVTLFNC